MMESSGFEYITCRTDGICVEWSVLESGYDVCIGQSRTDLELYKLPYIRDHKSR